MDRRLRRGLLQLGRWALWSTHAALPDLTLAEAIDTPRIHRVAGLSGGRTPFDGPVSRPHHTISMVGLIGVGQVPMPGEGDARAWVKLPNVLGIEQKF